MLAPLSVALAALACAQNPAWPLADRDATPEALARPEAMPDDPEYRVRASGTRCEGAFALFSFVPDCATAIDARERDRGTGVHADRAWLVTTGRAEVTLAVLGAGISWSNREVVGRVALNPGELPAPQGGAAAAHDANRDGAFDVRDFTSATGTVAPTIDRVIDPRLLARSDRGDVNGNGLLDPQDLIILFGNAADDDRNGYADDIAGWDFVDGDPDASEAALGPGQATERERLFDVALATANDGVGRAGVCPGCGGLPIRVTARGLALGNTAAAAIAYAVDRGARVVLAPARIAGGSTRLLASVAYANRLGALIVAGAGSESERHPTAPWPVDQVLIVGAVGFDRARPEDATSAAAPDPCSGRGAHVALTAPGRCDGTEAAITAGVAGLVLSASLGVPRQNVPPLASPLSGGELRAILIETREGLATPSSKKWGGRGLSDSTRASEAEAPVSGAEPTAGRVHARRAVDAIVRRRIPPVLTFLAPEPATLVDPTPLVGVEVRAGIEAPRAKRASWVLEWARGRSPEAAAFSPLASGTLGTEGEIAGRLPVESLFADPTSPPRLSSQDAEVTLRLTVNTETAQEPARASLERTVFVHRDLELLPDFPVALGVHALGAPRTLDLDGDGEEEIVVGTDDGAIHVILRDGSPRAGFPILGPAASRPSNGAAPADRSPELGGATGQALLGSLAGASWTATTATPVLAGVTEEGVVFTVEASGARRDASAFFGGAATSTLADGPTLRAIGGARAPALADLDGDGVKEIVVSTGRGVLVLDRALAPRPGFPVELGARVGGPAVGDLDGDGLLDVVVASADQVFAVHGDGTQHPGGALLSGFPASMGPRVPGEARGLGALLLPTPALADLDGDGTLEIAVSTRGRPEISLFDRAGVGWSAPSSEDGAYVGSGGFSALGDLDGDGRPDATAPRLAAGALETLAPEDSPELALALTSPARGVFLPGAPRLLGPPRGAVAILDVDADGRPEVVFDGGDGTLDAVNAEGTRPRLWPKLIGDALSGAPASGDLDGDGSMEVVAVTARGRVFAWRTRAAASDVLWNGVQHDDRGTGNLEAPEDGNVARVTSSCRTLEGSGSLWIAVLGLGLLARARVRSRRALRCSKTHPKCGARRYAPSS